VEKEESKGSRTALAWAVVSRFIGVRSRRERATFFCISLACALTRERPTLPRPFGARRVRSCSKQLQAFAVFQRGRAIAECGSRMVALHRRGSSQCGVKGECKGSGTAFDWAVLSHLIGVRSRRERATAECDANGKLNGGAAPPGQQSMRGERGVEEERNGIRLGGSFSFHWRALSARARHRNCNN
jgi:hypothetical protein